jgi:CheY-like chemotaxis protein
VEAEHLEIKKLNSKMSALDFKTILIVEDYEDDAKLLQLMLANAGIFNPIRIALSAEEAIAYLKGAPPDSNRATFPLPSVIFVDLKLPGIDGFEFLRWLRTHDELKGAFIVVLSATGDMISVQTAYALGANSFLVKPCRAADLENLVVRYPGFWLRTAVPLKPEADPPSNPNFRG